ncbi:MAG: efflux RND transporter periplasmic adaptor subunit [Dehalococcoidia bacterium]|nr:efflux RND transporter periplasmic adaptor subunit [Dehalococcoidia bacterium]MDD5493234.1 efflux RND transporter periplasmic adaptor subunit [Dehalococcoidia bacterium]
MANKVVDKVKSALDTTRGKVIFVVVIILILGGIGTGVYLGYQSINFVSTDNARISAALIPVSALSSCQIISMNVDYGSYVEKGQKIAEVGQPRPANPSDRQGFKEIPMGRASIESPVNGYVAAVWTYPGAVVNAGSPVVTVYDISSTWVMANISEAELHRIEPGQEVEISVDSLGGAKLKGTVEGVAAATAATFSLLPQNNTTGNFIKVLQVVPIKISVDNPQNYILVPGTSVEVKIATH